MKTLIGIIILACAVTSTGQVSGSFERLSGKRLSRFLKSKGKSEAGRNVSFRIPAKTLPAKTTKNSKYVRWQYKGVTCVLRANNPYWIQTSRKVRKSSKGSILIKGQVKVRTERDGNKSHYLWVKTLQKSGGAPSRKRRNQRFGDPNRVGLP